MSETYEDTDEVWMEHEGIEGKTHVPYSSFRDCWSENGWTITEAPALEEDEFSPYANDPEIREDNPITDNDEIFVEEEIVEL